MDNPNEWQKMNCKNELPSRVGFTLMHFITQDEKLKKDVDHLSIFGGENEKTSFKENYLLHLSNDLSTVEISLIDVSNPSNVTVRGFHSTCFDQNSSRL